ncbi:MAG: hypothetical protein ACO27F_03685 [Beijerinckiaceae bacterium]
MALMNYLLARDHDRRSAQHSLAGLGRGQRLQLPDACAGALDKAFARRQRGVGPAIREAARKSCGVRTGVLAEKASHFVGELLDRVGVDRGIRKRCACLFEVLRTFAHKQSDGFCSEGVTQALKRREIHFGAGNAIRSHRGQPPPAGGADARPREASNKGNRS